MYSSARITHGLGGLREGLGDIDGERTRERGFIYTAMEMLSSMLGQTFQHGCCKVSHALASDSHSLLLSKPENSVAPRVSFSGIIS